MFRGLLMLLLILTVVILIVFIAIAGITAYYRNRYLLKERARRIRLIDDRGGDHMRKVNVESATTIVPLLITPSSTEKSDRHRQQLLFIYARDAPEHCQCVYAFATLLRHQLSCTPILDAWSHSDIAESKQRWIQRAFADADYIVLVHSQGARLPYDSALLQSAQLIENNAGDIFDQLYLLMITQALALRASPPIIHVQFDYTTDDWLLHAALPETVYRLPMHIAVLAKLFDGGNARIESSAEWIALQSAIDAMRCRQEREPNWFQSLHSKTMPLVPDSYVCPGEQVKRDVAVDNIVVAIKADDADHKNDSGSTIDSGIYEQQSTMTTS